MIYLTLSNNPHGCLKKMGLEYITYYSPIHVYLLYQEYTGVTSKNYIQPATLAQQDIVITTYDVLRTELRATLIPHSNSEVEGRKLRRPKRFMAVPSPLPAVQWWRVCM